MTIRWRATTPFPYLPWFRVSRGSESGHGRVPSLCFGVGSENLTSPFQRQFGHNTGVFGRRDAVTTAARSPSVYGRAADCSSSAGTYRPGTSWTLELRPTKSALPTPQIDPFLSSAVLIMAASRPGYLVFIVAFSVVRRLRRSRVEDTRSEADPLLVQSEVELFVHCCADCI